MYRAKRRVGELRAVLGGGQCVDHVACSTLKVVVTPVGHGGPEPGRLKSGDVTHEATR